MPEAFRLLFVLSADCRLVRRECQKLFDLCSCSVPIADP